MLVADNLVKKFGNVAAVNGISLSLKPQEVLGFRSNGSGKTTTMRMLTRLYESNQRIGHDGWDRIGRQSDRG
jgi:ABC-type multidrug transport system ATPase subunit